MCDAASNQRRITIPPPVLDGHKVIVADDPIIYVLIEDMGGYGRALEALQQALSKIGDIENYYLDALLHYIQTSIAHLYPGLFDAAPDLTPAIFHVLTQTPVKRTTLLSSGLTVEGVIEMGLFDYTEKGTLQCPFALLCLLSKWSMDKALIYLTYLPTIN